MTQNVPTAFLKKSKQNWRTTGWSYRGALEMLAKAVLPVSVSLVVMKFSLEPWP